jgi:hypothetical protein
MLVVGREEARVLESSLSQHGCLHQSQASQDGEPQARVWCVGYAI